ncbi:hypothetical protein BHE74_00048875 [Ensete ventricosum]|nr:hypothetical protein BHE74_00048875 [Ensete ventricosum]
MHPLGFPNSNIKAKVFMRNSGFKLHMMRLNHVESFYAFLLRFRSKHNEEEDGRPATARPPTRVVGHGLATCKGVADYSQGLLQRGDWLRPRPPTQGATDCGQPAGVVGAWGHDLLQRDACRGGRLQGGGCQ